jgi:lipoate---protein ligase
LRVLEVEAPAVVLGSAQPEGHVDAGAAARAGLEIARRRSGGGAVLVGSGRCAWVDLLIGRDDPRWDDDVRRASRWVGEVWAEALAEVGVAGATVVLGMEPSPWSSRICFAGAGPGEVRVSGRKLVGLSQRRTRRRALFQCAVLLDADPAPLLDVLVLSDDDRRQAAGAWRAGTLALEAASVEPLLGALLRALAER